MKTLLQHVLPKIKPSMICIGTQKGGTTALYHYLSCHPKMLPSKIKEIDFFNCTSRFSKGTRFYHSHFPSRTLENLGKLTFDITPGYLGKAEITAQRIFDYNSNMRIVVLLRNPIKRAYSAWQMYRARVRNGDKEWFYEWVRRCDKNVSRDYFVSRSVNFGQDFCQDIINEIEVLQSGRVIEMPILLLGMYHKHLTYFLDLFCREQILVLASEDLKEDTKNQLSKIECFLDVNSYSWTSEELAPRFVGGYESTISRNAHVLLESFYKEHNEALFSLLQRELPWN